MLSIKGVLLVYIKKFGINSERSFLTSLKKKCVHGAIKNSNFCYFKNQKKDIVKGWKKKKKTGCWITVFLGNEFELKSLKEDEGITSIFNLVIGSELEI